MTKLNFIIHLKKIINGFFCVACFNSTRDKFPQKPYPSLRFCNNMISKPDFRKTKVVKKFFFFKIIQGLFYRLFWMWFLKKFFFKSSPALLAAGKILFRLAFRGKCQSGVYDFHFPVFKKFCANKKIFRLDRIEKSKSYKKNRPTVRWNFYNVRRSLFYSTYAHFCSESFFASSCSIKEKPKAKFCTYCTE